MKKFSFNQVANVVKFAYHVTMIASCVAGAILWFRWWKDYKKFLTIGATDESEEHESKWDLPDITACEKSQENRWGFNGKELFDIVRTAEDDDELY